MSPREVAAVLEEIAMLGELAGEDRFRTRAFSAAARTLEGTTADLGELARAGELTTLPGVGPAIAETIAELLATGRSAQHERLRAAVPVGVHDLLRLPGLGRRRVRALYAGLGIDSLDRLEAAALAGEVAALPGFGKRTEERVLEGIAFARACTGRRRYPGGMELAARFLDWLRAHPAVAAAELAGELRRRMETVGAVDLVAASAEPGAVVAGFLALEGAAGAGEAGEGGRASLRLRDGFRVRLRCVAPERFVAAVAWETGSAAHLAELAGRAESRGLRWDADGLRRGGETVPLPDEGALYAALGLAYVPPELREGLGEVAAAAEGRIPRLVETADLRGTFHCHTTWSDGTATLAEMAEAARARGWSYLGIADHSRAAAYAGGLSPAAALKQQREVAAWNAAQGGAGAGRFRLFAGTECDILPDGSLDYPDEVLAGFDYVVGSVHSAFGMTERAMTDRMLRAVENPRLTVLGHPTGRVLLHRDAYAVDVRAVIDAAAAHGAAIEINADPSRLDLDWRHVRYAAERGVLVPVNPDAHSTGGLDNVAFGVGAARKGWLSAQQVLNTWELEAVEELFAERKQGGAAGARRPHR
ncbi:MAG TPA: helix-hairpin-helix domain-containing protein [Longimicrobiaceae bacterium]|nr:helix-hairpin-helix domain-containing protein [Longimicrobiaceae bacterium]